MTKYLCICESSNVNDAKPDWLSRNHCCVSALQIPLSPYQDELMMIMKKSKWMGGLLHNTARSNSGSGESLILLLLQDFLSQFFSCCH